MFQKLLRKTFSKSKSSSSSSYDVCSTLERDGMMGGDSTSDTTAPGPFGLIPLMTGPPRSSITKWNLSENTSDGYQSLPQVTAAQTSYQPQYSNNRGKRYAQPNVSQENPTKNPTGAYDPPWAYVGSSTSNKQSESTSSTRPTTTGSSRVTQVERPNNKKQPSNRETSFVSTQTALNTLHQRLQCEIDENSKLVREIQRIQKEHESRVDQLNKKLKKSETVCQNIYNERCNLTKSNTSLEKRIKDLHERHTKVADAMSEKDAEIQNQKKKISELMADVKSLVVSEKSISRQREDMSARNNLHEKKCTKLEAELQVCKNENTDLKEKLKMFQEEELEDLSNLEAEVQERQDEIVRLKNTISELQATSVSKEELVSQANDESCKLSSRLTEMELHGKQEIEKLQNLISQKDVSWNEERTKMEEYVRELQEEIKASKEAFRNLEQKRIDDVTKIKMQESKLHEKDERIITAHHHIERQLKHMAKSSPSLDKYLRKVQNQFEMGDVLQCIEIDYDKMVLELKYQCTQLEILNQKQEAKIGSMIKNEVKLTNKISEYVKEHTDIEKYIKEIKAEYEQERKRLQETVHVSNKERVELMQANADIQIQNDNLEKKLSDVNVNYHNCYQELKRLTDNVSEHKQKIIHLQNEIQTERSKVKTTLLQKDSIIQELQTHFLKPTVEKELEELDAQDTQTSGTLPVSVPFEKHTIFFKQLADRDVALSNAMKERFTLLELLHTREAELLKKDGQIHKLEADAISLQRNQQLLKRRLQEQAQDILTRQEKYDICLYAKNDEILSTKKLLSRIQQHDVILEEEIETLEKEVHRLRTQLNETIMEYSRKYEILQQQLEKRAAKDIPQENKDNITETIQNFKQRIKQLEHENHRKIEEQKGSEDKFAKETNRLLSQLSTKDNELAKVKEQTSAVLEVTKSKMRQTVQSQEATQDRIKRELFNLVTTHQKEKTDLQERIDRTQEEFWEIQAQNKRLQASMRMLKDKRDKVPKSPEKPIKRTRFTNTVTVADDDGDRLEDRSSDYDAKKALGEMNENFIQLKMRLESREQQLRIVVEQLNAERNMRNILKEQSDASLDKVKELTKALIDAEELLSASENEKKALLNKVESAEQDIIKLKEENLMNKVLASNDQTLRNKKLMVFKLQSISDLHRELMSEFEFQLNPSLSKHLINQVAFIQGRINMLITDNANTQVTDQNRGDTSNKILETFLNDDATWTCDVGKRIRNLLRLVEKHAELEASSRHDVLPSYQHTTFSRTCCGDGK